MDLSKYVAAADSRQLSVASAGNHTWLLYELNGHDVAVLNGSPQDFESFIWKDISKKFQASIPDRFSAPFTAWDYNGVQLQSIFASKDANGSYSQEALVSSEESSDIFTC